MGGLCKNGKLENAGQIFEELVIRLAKKGRMHGALTVLEVMLQKGFPPDTYTWIIAVRGACKIRKVHQTIDDCWRKIHG